MAIKDRHFRVWTGREDFKLGWTASDWQRYFSAEELELFAAGEATADLKADRQRFWNYAKNENRRVARVAETGVPVRPRTKGLPKRAVLPRRISIACARYWYFAHILPRGEGKRTMGPDYAAKILGLNDADKGRILVRFPQALCEQAARNVEHGDYPKIGFLWQQAERMSLPADKRGLWTRSPKPPNALESFIDPIHYSLGLSHWFPQVENEVRLTYRWHIGRYLEGADLNEAQVKSIADSPEDYREKLLSIFD